jgi:hypothetical protein
MVHYQNRARDQAMCKLEQLTMRSCMPCGHWWLKVLGMPWWSLAACASEAIGAGRETKAKQPRQCAAQQVAQAGDLLRGGLVVSISSCRLWLS